MSDVFEIDGAKAQLFRDGPDWEGTPTAAIGKFRCDTAEAGTELLMTITRQLSSDGLHQALGPMDGDTWHSYRLVTESDGSAPFLMEPTSGPHDLAAFEAAGFAPVSHYFSARAAISDAIGTAPPDDPAIRIRTWDGQDPEAHFAQVHALSSEAFAGNAFYAPLSREAFLEMYMPFVPLLKRELILMAEDAGGALIGFLFGIPNYAEGPASTTVILKTYAGLRPGVGHRLAHAFHVAAAEMGYGTAIHALIHDDNRSAARSAQHGGQIFRRYALMGWRDNG